MKRFTNKVLSEVTGIAVVGARITVYLTGTNTKATLFRSNDINGTTVSNPIAAGATGRFFFYTADGLYDFLVEFGARQVRVDEIEIVDALDLSRRIDGIPAGPASAFRANLAALKAASTNDGYSFYDGSAFVWTTGDYTGLADDMDIIESDNQPITVGAWVRKRGGRSVDLRDFGGAPNGVIGFNDNALAAALAGGAKTIILGQNPDGAASWVFSTWPVALMDGITIDADPDVTISHQSDTIMTPFGSRIGYARPTNHVFRGLGESCTYTSWPESTPGGYHKTLFLHEAGPDYSTYTPVLANNANTVVPQKLPDNGSDVWAADPFPNSVERGFTITPGVADGSFHMGFKKVLPGEEYSARPYIIAGNPLFAMIVRHSKGFDGIMSNSLTPPSIDHIFKATGSARGGQSLGFINFPIATHSSYWPLNSRWRVKIESWNTYAVYYENFLIDRRTVAGFISDVGFGMYPLTAADSGGFFDLVSARDLPLSSGQIWSQAFFGDSRSASRDGAWPLVARQILDMTYGIRCTRMDNFAVGGESSGQQLARMQALGDGLRSYNGVHVNLGTNDVQGGTDIAVIEANIITMINLIRNAGAIPTVSVFDLWYTQGQAPGHGQASSRYDAGGPVRQMILRICANMGVKVIDDSAQPGPILANWINPQLTPSFVNQGDPVNLDNIHPTMRRNVLTAYGWVRALLGTMFKKPTFALGPQEVVYSAGFAAGAQQPIYSISAAGNVGHRGLVVPTGGASTANGTRAFILPAHVRPDRTLRVPARGSAGWGALNVDPSGDVTLLDLAGTTFIDISNLQYQLPGT